MSEIVESKQALPLPELSETREMLFTESVDDVWQRCSHWESHGEKGALFVAQIAYASAIKTALEKDHPYKEGGHVVKDWESLKNEYDFLVAHKETDILGRETYPFRDKFYASICAHASKWFPHFLTDDLRAYVVKLHARGNSTVNAINYILSPACEMPTVFSHFKDLSNFNKKIIEWLTPRLSYLKLGSAAFPKKYHALWHEAREEYLTEIKGVPYTETTEQVKALSDLYSRLEDAFTNAKDDNAKAKLSASMVKVMSGLYTLTQSPEFNMQAGTKLPSR